MPVVAGAKSTVTTFLPVALTLHSRFGLGKPLRGPAPLLAPSTGWAMKPMVMLSPLCVGEQADTPPNALSANVFAANWRD